MSSFAEKFDPSRWREFDPDDRLGLIPVHLAFAASGDDVAWNLSGCLDSVSRRENRIVISEEVRDGLIRLTVRAEIAAHAALSAIYARDIHSGMQALAELFDTWASLEELRPSASADNRDRRRILQNICHSQALRENIENRAYARRAIKIEALIDGAVKPRRAAG